MSSNLRKCPNCSGMNPAEAKFCTYCGAKLEAKSSANNTTERRVYQQEYQESPYQSSDYSRSSPSAPSSSEDGNKSYQQSNQRYSQSDIDRTVAGILALVLGSIGVHCFYLGDTGKGILYLCFSWTGIPAILGIIEGIIYLTESDQEFYSRHVHTQY